MKLIKLIVLCFVLSFNTAFADGIWCGYSEFVQGHDDPKSQAQIDGLRANKCAGQPGSSGVPTQITVQSLDGSRECVVSNTKIADNLLKLKSSPCDSDCHAAYQAIQMQDPETIRNSDSTKDIYEKIFGKCQ